MIAKCYTTNAHNVIGGVTVLTFLVHIVNKKQMKKLLSIIALLIIFNLGATANTGNKNPFKHKRGHKTEHKVKGLTGAICVGACFVVLLFVSPKQF
jgi:hypothetical protein